nr:methyl transferase/helicase [Grapevine leafroll-associated virus 13]
MAGMISFGSFSSIPVKTSSFKPFTVAGANSSNPPAVEKIILSKKMNSNGSSPVSQEKTIKPAFQKSNEGKIQEKLWVRGKRPNVIVGNEGRKPQPISPKAPVEVKKTGKISEFSKLRPYGDLNGIFRSMPLGKGRGVNYAVMTASETHPYLISCGGRARHIRNVAQVKQMRDFATALAISSDGLDVCVKTSGMGKILTSVVKVFSGKANVSMPGVAGVDLEAKTDDNIIAALDGDTILIKPKGHVVLVIYSGGRLIDSEAVKQANERRRSMRMKSMMDAFVAEGGRWKSGAIVLKNGVIFNELMGVQVQVKTTNAWLRIYDVDAKKNVYISVSNGRINRLCIEGRIPTVIDFIKATPTGSYIDLPRTSFYCPISKRMVSTESGWCWAPLYGYAGVRYSPYAACAWRSAALVFRETGVDISVTETNKPGYYHVCRTGNLRVSSLKHGSMLGGSNTFMASISQALSSEDVFDGLASNVANKLSLKEGSAVIRELDNSVAAILQNKANVLNSKPASIITPCLTSAEKNMLTQHFPELRIEFKDSVFSSHAMCNAVRSCFNCVFSENYKEIPFLDIGGSISYHIKRGHVNAHCCNPTTDVKDAKRRESELLSLRREIYGDSTIDQLSSSVASKTATFCMKDTRVCDRQCEVGFMVDVYDLGIYDLAKALSKKGVRIFDMVFMLPVELIARDGVYVIQELDTVVSRRGDVLTYTVGRSGDSYTHSFNKVHSLLTCPAATVPGGNTYTTEYMGYRCGYHHIQMSRYSGGDTVRSVSRSIHTTLHGKTIVKAPFFLRDILSFKEVIVDTEFVQRVYNYALNVTTTFSERTFEYAMSSFRSQKTNVVVGTRVVQSRVDISMGDEAGVVLAILIEALRGRRSAVAAYSKIEFSCINLKQMLLLIWERLKLLVKRYFLESSQAYMMEMVPWVEDIMQAQNSLFYVVPRYCTLEVSGEMSPQFLDYDIALRKGVEIFSGKTKEKFNANITTEMAREAYKILKAKKAIEAQREEMTPSPVTVDELAEFINENVKDLHATLRRHKPFGGRSKLNPVTLASFSKYVDTKALRKGVLAWFTMISPALLIRPNSEAQAEETQSIQRPIWRTIISRTQEKIQEHPKSAAGLGLILVATPAYVYRRKVMSAVNTIARSTNQTCKSLLAKGAEASTNVCGMTRGVVKAISSDVELQCRGHISERRRGRYFWGVLSGYISFHKPMLWTGVITCYQADMCLMSVLGGVIAAITNACGTSMFFPDIIGRYLKRVNTRTAATSFLAMASIYYVCRKRRFPQKVTIVKNLNGCNVYEMLASELRREGGAIQWTNEIDGEISGGENMGDESVSQIFSGSEPEEIQATNQVHDGRHIAAACDDPVERIDDAQEQNPEPIPAHESEEESDESESEESEDEDEDESDESSENPDDSTSDESSDDEDDAGASGSTVNQSGESSAKSETPGKEVESTTQKSNVTSTHEERSSVVKRRSLLRCACGVEIKLLKAQLPHCSFGYTDRVKGRDIVLYTKQPETYTYGKISHNGRPWLSHLDEIINLTEGDHSYNQCLVQRYDEGAIIPFHSDNEACYERDHKVLTVNLVGLANFRVKCVKGEGSAVMGANEWFVMPAGFQRTHKHSVISRSLYRISLTFRTSKYQGAFDAVEAPIEKPIKHPEVVAKKYVVPHKRARSEVSSSPKTSETLIADGANSEISLPQAAQFSTMKVMQSYNALANLKWMYEPDPAVCVEISSQCPVTPNLSNTPEEAAPIEYVLYLAYRVYNLHRALTAAADYLEHIDVSGDRWPKAFYEATPGLRVHDKQHKNLYIISESVSVIYDLEYIYSVRHKRFIRGRDIDVLCTGVDKLLVCDDLAPFHDALNLRAVISLARTSLVGRNLLTMKMKYVNSPPGGGKTTRLCDTFMKRKEAVVIATANSGSAEDINTELKRRASESETTKPIEGGEARTANSWIINPMKKGSSFLALIDEVYLLHKGQLAFCLSAMRCVEAICYGDVNQIPFSNREKMFVMHYSAITPNEKDIEYTNISYRCPADVCYLLSKMTNAAGKPCYPNGVQAYENKRPLRSMTAIPINGASEAIQADVDVFLTYTQADKADLIRERIGSAKNTPVYTIHEAQGKTFERVALVRLKKADDSVIKGLPHALVGISRHTRSFIYMTYNSRLSDRVGSLVADASPKTVSDVVLQGLQRFDRFRGN